MGIINDVKLTPLKIIKNDKGDILHALKENEESFVSFGEAYFSTILQDEIKGWKKHTLMTLNIIVPIGSIYFKLIDGRKDSSTFKKEMEITLSIENYQRLTVPPGIWMGFKGMGNSINMLLNIASILHNPNEGIALPIENNSLKMLHF